MVPIQVKHSVSANPKQDPHLGLHPILQETVTGPVVLSQSP